MTSDKEEPMTDKLHQPMTDKEEQAKTDKLHQPMTSDKEEQGRGLKRRRSAAPPEINERGAVSAGLTF